VAQPLIREFVAELDAKLRLPAPVVEFGALQVEAEQDGDLRPLFGDRPFTGTDFREGKGVDRVEDLRALTFEDGEVGTALCLDTLEHCEDPPQACRELARATSRDGGVAVISSVMLFGIHAYPSDYFRFTPEGFRSLLSPFDHSWVVGVGSPDIPTQVIGVGSHGRPLDLDVSDFPSIVALQRRYDEAPGEFRIGVHNYSPASLAREVSRSLPRVVKQQSRSLLDRLGARR
jgi:SAM-dependent methyltransferase